MPTFGHRKEAFVEGVVVIGVKKRRKGSSNGGALSPSWQKGCIDMALACLRVVQTERREKERGCTPFARPRGLHVAAVPGNGRLGLGRHERNTREHEYARREISADSVIIFLGCGGL